MKGTKAEEENESFRGETKGAGSVQGDNRMHEGFLLKNMNGDNKGLREKIKGTRAKKEIKRLRWKIKGAHSAKEGNGMHAGGHKM